MKETEETDSSLALSPMFRTKRTFSSPKTTNNQRHTESYPHTPNGSGFKFPLGKTGQKTLIFQVLETGPCPSFPARKDVVEDHITIHNLCSFQIVCCMIRKFIRSPSRKLHSSTPPNGPHKAASLGGTWPPSSAHKDV